MLTEFAASISDAAGDQPVKLGLAESDFSQDGFSAAATLDGNTLRGRFEPRDVCARLVAAYAPIVSEISRRSCAPNELMLRRDVGGGRREAVFITRAELRARLTRLPPSLRVLFDPFQL